MDPWDPLPKIKNIKLLNERSFTAQKDLPSVDVLFYCFSFVDSLYVLIEFFFIHSIKEENLN